MIYVAIVKSDDKEIIIKSEYFNKEAFKDDLHLNGYLYNDKMIFTEKAFNKLFN